MNWLIIPILIWLAALLVMMLPKFIFKKIENIKSELLTNAEQAQHTNPVESKNKKIKEDIMDTVHIKGLSFISSIIASLLIVLGTLAFCIVLLL